MMRNPLHEEGSLNILQKISQFSKEGQEKTNSTREETGFFLGHLFFLPRIQVKLPGNSAFSTSSICNYSSVQYFVDINIGKLEVKLFG